MIMITVLATVVVHAVKDLDPLQNMRFYDFPLTIGKWQGREIKVQDYVYQALGTKYVLLRDYTSSMYPTPVNLSIVWTDDTALGAIHAPEECLGGVGITVQNMETHTIKLDRNYEVGKLIVERNGNKDVVIYYYNDGGYITTSHSALRLRVLKERFKCKRASISFVRLMAPITSSEEEAIHTVEAFLKDTYPVMLDYTNVR